MTMISLTDRLSELEEILGSDYDESAIKEAFEYEDYSTEIGDYEFAFEDGYSGEEGGGEDVRFICSIRNTKTQEKEYYFVKGWYSSWDGSTIYWDQANKVEDKLTQVTVTRTAFYDENGKLVYKIDKDA